MRPGNTAIRRHLECVAQCRHVRFRHRLQLAFRHPHLKPTPKTALNMRPDALRGVRTERTFLFVPGPRGVNQANSAFLNKIGMV